MAIVTTNRKQRYVLGADDLVQAEFWSAGNADRSLAGLNASGATEQLAVAVGGTNNDTFLDGKFVVYDAATQKLQSSADGPASLGDLVAVAGSGLYTGALVSSQSVTTTELGTSSVPVASVSFARPASARWSWLRVVFTTWIQYDTNPGAISGLVASLTAGTELPSGWGSTFSGPYLADNSGEETQIVWVAEGPVPDLSVLDDTLTVTVSALGASGGVDMPAKRGVYAVAYYKQAQAAESSVAHGVPTFLATPVSVYSRADTEDRTAVAWTTFPVTDHVPATASALLLEASGGQEGPDGTSVSATTSKIWMRRDSGIAEAGNLLLLQNRAAASGDRTAVVNQGIYPFGSLGGVRSFQYKIDVGFDRGVSIRLLGYIS